MLYAYLREARRVPLQTQRDAIQAADIEPDLTVVEGEGKRSIYDLVGLKNGAPAELREGDWLLVYRYDLLAEPKLKKGDRAPRKSLREITERLREIGVTVIELLTGRSTATHGVEIYADAVDRLAGGGNHGARGRPAKHDYSKEDCELIRLLWKNGDMKTNRDRVASVRTRFPDFNETAWYRLQNAGKV